MENINPNSDKQFQYKDTNATLPWTWKRLVDFARHPGLEHPSRDATQEQRYTSYKKWCSENDLTNADYIRKFVAWHPVYDIGLEPCLVPYYLESDVKHFILWFNDRSWGNSGFTPKKPTLCQDEIGNVLSESDFIWRMIQISIPSYKNRSKKEEHEKEIIWYENHPDWKSIPAIRHLHVFFRANDANADVIKDLKELETAWISRSVFLKSEVV